MQKMTAFFLPAVIQLILPKKANIYSWKLQSMVDMLGLSRTGHPPTMRKEHSNSLRLNCKSFKKAKYRLKYQAPAAEASEKFKLVEKL
jgi:hypothetical protein